MRLLFVDHNVQFLNTIQTCLKWYGFDVDILGNSDKAISLLEKNDYDVLVCDIYSLPMSGYRLCRLLYNSRIPRLTSLPILLTGPEEPGLDEYIALKRPTLFFMNKYESVERWAEKISTICQIESAVL